MIARNLASIKSDIVKAAERAGRKSEEIKLICVSKTFGADKVLEAYEAGARDFGENRVREAKSKIESIDADIRWHLIGHLQTNKAKSAVKLFDVIHSVDSVRLAKILDESVEKSDKSSLEVLLQVNVGEEPQKSGVMSSDVIESVKEILKLKSLNLTGLMTIPPYSPDKEVTRRYYKDLRIIKDNANKELGREILTELSMGMSDDYRVAIEEGATYLRIGTALFGERDYSYQYG